MAVVWGVRNGMWWGHGLASGCPELLGVKAEHGARATLVLTGQAIVFTVYGALAV